jgi:tungstate transport system substrate-binding protein
MRRLAGILAIVAIVACGGQPPTAATATSAPRRPERPDLLLATTTSTQDSGLLDVLIPDFEKRTGYKVKANAVGTGAALALGAKGDADVVLVHAPSAEEDYMRAGNGDRRLLVMHNDFITLGPPGDPAHVRGLKVFDAFRAIAAANATFISRGDNSGTDILEKSLWKQIGITPQRPWYVEAATGMGQTLTIASEKRAYTISDRGTYLSRTSDLALEILVEKDPPLINIYHVITVSASKFPRVNKAGADAFAGYLVSKEAQEIIAKFGVDKFGQPLFFPDAGKKDEDLSR